MPDKQFSEVLKTLSGQKLPDKGICTGNEAIMRVSKTGVSKAEQKPDYETKLWILRQDLQSLECLLAAAENMQGADILRATVGLAHYKLSEVVAQVSHMMFTKE